jgi:hypothetical protein
MTSEPIKVLLVDDNPEIRNTVLVWAMEPVFFFTSGTSVVSAANRTAGTQVSFDGGAVQPETSITTGATVSGGGGLSMNVNISGIKAGLSEGLHYATLFGAASTGTATWNSANTNSTAQTTLTIVLQG